MTRLIPREILFGNPDRTNPGISPDGKRLAYLAPIDGVLNVWAGTVGAEDFAPITKETTRSIAAAFWTWDNQHILYARDSGGDENYHVFLTNVDSQTVVDLTPFEGVQALPLALDKRFPDEVLISMNKDKPQLMDVWKITLSTGNLTKVADNPGFGSWITDHDFKLRAAVAPTSDGGSIVSVRDTEDSPWREVYQTGQADGQTAVLGFSKDGTSLRILTAKDSNAARLIELNLESEETSVVAEDATYDLTGAVIDPDTREIQAVAFIKARQEWRVLDEEVAPDFKAIGDLQPGDFSIVGRDASNRTWLVSFNADNQPLAYWTYDRDSRQGTFLFHHQPALAEYELAEMEPFSLKSRDGLDLHGYLTFPSEQRENLPAVLFVHGGPWGRDVWGFNPTAQWLANRGYLCVQINFRGSTGYGNDFLNAGDKQWGAKMHDDLIDAVDWVIAQGYADRERFAIYGGSYGGYAALAGVTFTPEVFACSVDLVGPSNLKTLIESIPPYWAPIRSNLISRMGDPETEADMLWERSPLSKVDQICRPLLIAQGANDPRVKQAESEQIVAAMRQRGIDHEYLLYPDEGHGFVQPQNNLHFHGAAERFLAQHLGGRYEPEPA